MTAPRPCILIIEDEPDLARGLELNFAAEGYAVMKAATGDDGIRRALDERPDLVLLDVMLPGTNGFDVCRELRHRHFSAPIIMLTARSEETDRVVGFEIGADDYVTKPFGIRELLARIRARLRPPRGGSHTAAFGSVSVNFDRHEVTRDGKRVDLTAKELQVLEMLVAHRGKVVTRDQLLEEVWGYETYPTTRTVDNHVLRLRQKLEETPSDPRYIMSVYGAGNKFVG